MGFDENELTLADLERFLESEGAATSAAEDSETAPVDTTETAEPAKETENQTKAFAHRLKEATNKARADERETIAKSMGYENYAAMQKAHEKRMLEDKGLDPEEVSPIVDQLVQKKLAEDPRLKELDEYRQRQMKVWAEKEVGELKELTGGKITKIDEIPKDVLDLWKTKGSLKGAYLELHGEELIKSMRVASEAETSKGTTQHLGTPAGGAPAAPLGGKSRPYTEQEKSIYRMFNPSVTEEELNKLTKPM